MPQMNKTEIIGHLSNEPEMRFTPQGKSVTSFTVPVNRYYEKDGKRVQQTDWFGITCWGKIAEACNKFLHKGSLVYVEGRVKLHTWDKKDGGTGSRLELNANHVLFLSKFSDAESGKDLELNANHVLFPSKFSDAESEKDLELEGD